MNVKIQATILSPFVVDYLCLSKAETDLEAETLQSTSFKSLLRRPGSTEICKYTG